MARRTCNLLEAERNKLDNQLGDLLCAIGKTAAQDPDVAKALPELSSTLAPDLANRLATALKYFADERARLTNGPPGAARDDARPSQGT